MKIPRDVTTIRQKLAQASVKLKRPVQQTTTAQTVQTKDPRIQKANQEAAENRRKAREAMQTAAERDARIQELEAAKAEYEKKLAELEPAAERWNKYAHTTKERLIQKFPKEDQAALRKMDVDHVRFMANKLGIETGASTSGGTTAAAGKPPQIGSIQDAAKVAESDPVAYNKFMDDVASGAVKVDSAGKVLA